jgi:hypothetical protein
MTTSLLVPRSETTPDDSVDAAVDRLAAEFRDRLGPRYIRRHRSAVP